MRGACKRFKFWINHVEIYNHDVQRLALFALGSVRISQAHVLHLVSTCIDHGEQNNGSGTVSGLGFQHR